MNTALNRSTVGLLTNKSGGSVAQGDVVIVDSANATAFTTTTTSSFAGGSIGVVLEPNGIPSNAIGTVAFGGYVPIVNLSSSASLGDLFHAHSVAKQALRHAAPIVGGDFGQVLGTGTTPAAFLWGQPAAAAGAGSTTLAGDSDVTISSPAAHDILQYSGSTWANVQGGMMRLGQQTLGVATTTITFSSIAGTYSELRLVVYGRSNLAALGDDIMIRFNSDTAANYDYQTLSSAGATPAASQSLGVTFAYVGALSGATAPANAGSALIIEIPFYANTTFQKFCLARSADKQGTTSGLLNIRSISSWWRNTAAITRIDIFSSSTGQFITGSQATLYGIA